MSRRRRTRRKAAEHGGFIQPRLIRQGALYFLASKLDYSGRGTRAHPRARVAETRGGQKSTAPERPGSGCAGPRGKGPGKAKPQFQSAGLDSSPHPGSPERVDCSRCGRSNPGHVRYCLDCGSNLVQGPAEESAADPRVKVSRGPRPADNICGTCNTKNPLDARFCRECGALLGAGADQPQSSDPQSPNPYTPAPYASHLLDVEAPPPPAQEGDPPERRNFRPSQGHVHGETSKRCQRCSGHSAPTALFCQFCGASFESSPPAPRRSPEPPSPRNAEVPKAELVVIAQDGSPGRRYPLSGGDILIGSSEQAPVSLRRDPYVCAEHARIVYRNGGFFVEDIAPHNGVYVRIGGAVPLRSGDLLLLGLAVLCFEIMDESERHLSAAVKGGVRLFGTPPSPRYARLSLQSVEGVPRDVYYLSRAETVLGREVGDLVFTDDPFMSRRHAAIRRDPNNNQFTLRDLGSSNGTFIAIRGRHAISHGDHIRVGQHLFRLDVRRGE